MDECILLMKDELEHKDRSVWDETDWDTYYYILSLESNT